MILVLVFAAVSSACPIPEVPRNGRVVQSNFNASSHPIGAVVNYTCDEGFLLLGLASRTCHSNGWEPRGLPPCVANVATGKFALQSTSDSNGGAHLAVDGDSATCSSTLPQESPWFVVDLEDVHPIFVVRLDFPTSMTLPPNIILTVRVGNLSAGNLSAGFQSSSVCNEFHDTPLRDRALYLPCSTTLTGRQISLHLLGNRSLALCELGVYSDRATHVALRDDPTRFGHSPKKKAFYELIGMKGFIGVCVGLAVLIASICLCCCWTRGRRWCYRESSNSVLLKEFTREPTYDCSFEGRSLDEVSQDSPADRYSDFRLTKLQTAPMAGTLVGK
ncbi:unnamed protein product [Ixodes persulcatus]